jgi:hypothetical protein
MTPDRHCGIASIAERAHAINLVAAGAFAWHALGISPAKIAYVLLGLLGLAAVAYVAVPVLKALGVCWSAKIKARLMPKQQRSRRGRTRKRS